MSNILQLLATLFIHSDKKNVKTNRIRVKTIFSFSAGEIKCKKAGRVKLYVKSQEGIIIGMRSFSLYILNVTINHCNKKTIMNEVR